LSADDGEAFADLRKVREANSYDRQAWGIKPKRGRRGRGPSDAAGRTYNAKQRRRRRRKIFERDGYRCAGCDRVFPYEALTLDHVVPVAKGGSNHRSNLQTMCEPCNQAKADS
jgi:5-methylcytosine-specific restriction endonuclease McrA